MIEHYDCNPLREKCVEIEVCYGGDIFGVVTLLKDYFHRYPTVPSAPILSSFADGNLTCVTYPQGLSMLKHWGLKAGMNKKLGIHSLRRGAATLIFLGDFTLEDIKDPGDWRS